MRTQDRHAVRARALTVATRLLLGAAAGCTGAAGRHLVDGRHALTAYLLLAVADCDSHLGTLGALQRAEWTSRLSLGGVILIGAPRDSATVRRALESYDLPLDVVTTADPRYAELRAAARARRFPPSPSLVVFDSGGRPVLARRAPSSPAAMESLHDEISRLLASAR